MKKLIIVVVLILVLSAVVYFLYLQGIDTKYATAYSKCFGSFEISQVDKFLKDSTAITYKGKTSTYKDLRANIINAFSEKKFNMSEGSSYGSGNNRFINGVQTIGVQSYVNYNNKSVEVYIEMQLRKVGFSRFEVKSLSCNDDFFGYLFFGTVE